jgi:hypothetical protein
MSTTAPSAATPASPPLVDGVLRCVSSGYLGDGCSCHATVPARVVRDAWAHERVASRDDADRFFAFRFRGESWLSYGMRDGGVRGVYCPEHRARRAERVGGRERQAV